MDPITAVLAGMSLGSGVVKLIGDIVSRAQTDPVATDAYVFANYDKIVALLGEPSPAAVALAEERQKTVETIRELLKIRTPTLIPTPAPLPMIPVPDPVQPPAGNDPVAPLVVPTTVTVQPPAVVTPVSQPVADPLPVVLAPGDQPKSPQ